MKGVRIFLGGMYILAMLFLVAPTIFAGNIRISYEILKDYININNSSDYAEFYITITNLGNENLQIIPDAKPFDKWIAVFDPSMLIVLPNESKGFFAKVYAKGFEPFPNQVIISFYAYGKEYEVYLPIKVLGLKFKSFPNLHIDYYYDNYVYPGKCINFRLIIDNEENKTIHLGLEAKLDIFYEDYKHTLDIPPNSRLVKNYKFCVKENAAPGNYEANIVFDLNGYKIVKILRFSVLEKEKNIEIITKENEIEIVNHENKPVYYTLSMELSKLRAVFFKFNIEPKRITYVDGKFIYTWEFVLHPKEKIIIKAELNFGLIFVILLPLLIALILFVGYYLLGFRVDISKSVVKIDRERGEIKIEISVTNKSKRKFSDITIRDYIPAPFVLVEEFEFLEPKLINITEEGTEIYWTVKDLNPGEERIFTYKIRVPKDTKGTIVLPSAKVIKNGKPVKSSFPVFIHFT